MSRKGIRIGLALVVLLTMSMTAAAPFASASNEGNYPQQAAAPPEALLDCAPSNYESAGTSTRPKPTAQALVGNPITERAPRLASSVNACLAEVHAADSEVASEIRFASDWQSAQVDLMLAAVARYERIVGQTRLRSLLRTALTMRERSGTQLTFIRGSEQGAPVAYWAPSKGQIVLNDSLFDPQFVQSYYVWTAFLAWRNSSPEMVTIQDAIVAHELGHVIVDALEMEQQTLAPNGPSPEMLYLDYVSPQSWPHNGGPVKENLATEFALLSLGIARPGDAMAFRSEVMLPALAGTYWISSPMANGDIGTLLSEAR